MHTPSRVSFAAVLSAAALCTVALAAEPLLYDNGPFITATGVGANGADVSVTEPNPPTNVTALSFNANLASGSGGPARVGDDFTITDAPAWGVRIKHMHFFANQQQSASNNPQFAAVYVAIYDGDPLLGASIVAGDFTTNRIISSTFTNAYRVASTSLTSATRPITRLDVDMSWAPALQDGTYWIMVSAAGDPLLSGQPTAFFVTPHVATDTGRQYFNSGYFSTWDYPFKLFGYCPSDFNYSGQTTIDDIFIYLNAWFSNDPRANTDGVGGVEINDIFVFLNTWFSGC